ncbi:hypothetical protein BDN72DRAFT_683372 [Pluteus cervinus]|uniref:Uncharacterized protein n=1 Tax=Pluteus cervinus TaxID=181527 RepID=A0ACD3ATT1_9AGAR|nr:hypothetical protein BDN72DRAFT_683372 [Pluteus cervinus]
MLPRQLLLLLLLRFASIGSTIYFVNIENILEHEKLFDLWPAIVERIGGGTLYKDPELSTTAEQNSNQTYPKEETLYPSQPPTNDLRMSAQLPPSLSALTTNLSTLRASRHVPNHHSVEFQFLRQPHPNYIGVRILILTWTSIVTDRMMFPVGRGVDLVDDIEMTLAAVL